MNSDFVTVKEVSTRLPVSERTVAKWIRLGRIPCYRPEKGKRMVRWSEVEAYLESTRMRAAANEKVMEALRGLLGKPARRRHA